MSKCCKCRRGCDEPRGTCASNEGGGGSGGGGEKRDAREGWDLALAGVFWKNVDDFRFFRLNKF